MPVPVVVVFWNILWQPMSLYHPSVLLEDELNGGQDRENEGEENQSQDENPKDQCRGGNSFRFVCSWCAAGLLVSASPMLKSLVL